jgi:integrase/recombinase XerD
MVYDSSRRGMGRVNDYGVVTISKDDSGRITVSFHYNPQRVEKVKTIPRHRWHPDNKQWSFPNTDGTLEKILEVFKGEGIHIDPALYKSARVDPALQAEVSSSSISYSPTLVKPSYFPPLEKGGGGGFEDLRRELVSRKYSYRTVKGYLYYNRDFMKFSGKRLSYITDNDIKNYLLYLAEEKQSATSTLNQAINALKFYYGAI